jgi:hypothetical protein
LDQGAKAVCGQRIFWDIVVLHYCLPVPFGEASWMTIRMGGEKAVAERLEAIIM